MRHKGGLCSTGSTSLDQPGQGLYNFFSHITNPYLSHYLFLSLWLSCTSPWQRWRAKEGSAFVVPHPHLWNINLILLCWVWIEYAPNHFTLVMPMAQQIQYKMGKHYLYLCISNPGPSHNRGNILILLVGLKMSSLVEEIWSLKPYHILTSEI